MDVGVDVGVETCVDTHEWLLGEEESAWPHDRAVLVGVCACACVYVRAGLPALVCLFCGMMTATFGGLTRDALCRKPPRILHSKASMLHTAPCAAALTTWPCVAVPWCMPCPLIGATPRVSV